MNLMFIIIYHKVIKKKLDHHSSQMVLKDNGIKIRDLLPLGGIKITIINVKLKVSN